MALWQYTFQVLPKDSIEILCPEHYFKRSDSGFDDEPYWMLNPVNKRLFDSVQDILPKSKSWSNEIELYGSQDSNCFEVLFDNKGQVHSASFRIDFRSNYEEILSKIIEFCLLNGLVILNEFLNMVSLNYEQVQRTIKDSSQVRKYNELASIAKQKGS